jgi:uncharacterized repeat protein (TIGR01451 family)
VVKGQRGSGTRAAAGALVCTMALIGAASAHAAPSTITKTGADGATGSSATSGGAPGNANPGDTINWVVNYRNTTGARATVDILDPIAGNQTFVPGSLKTPPSLTPRWSTDGGASFAASEPASGVNAVGATGTSIDGATGAQSPAFTAPPVSFNGAGGGGDGYKAIFVGPNLYNVHHHTFTGAGGGALIDCHVKATGARCTGWGTGGLNASETAGTPLSTAAGTYDTAEQNFYAFDAATGRVYTPVGIDGTARVGLACIDLSNNTSCGFIQLGTAAFNNTAAGAQPEIGAATQIGTKIYAIGDQAQVYCYDYAAAAACPGYPVSSIPAFNNTTQASDASASNLQVYDSRYVWVNFSDAAANRKVLSCIDTTTNTLCSGFPVTGSAGISGAGDSTIAPLLSTTGAVTGACIGHGASFNCFDLAGASVANPYPAQGGACVGLVCSGQGTVIGTKVYQPYFTGATATFTCFDFATQAACANYTAGVDGGNIRPYTLTPDRLNPGCIWEVGDAGVFDVFDAVTGQLGCPATSVHVPVRPAASYCDGGSGHVTGWNDIVIDVPPADYTSATITLTDANGNVVPGWRDRSFTPAQQTIDISAIPVTGSTATLDAAVTLHGATAAVAGSFTLTYIGDAVQMCFQTKVGAPKCAAQSIANNANAVTVGDNNVSDAPRGKDSGSAAFAMAGVPALCVADLSVTKKPSTTTAAPGQNVVYTITVTNNGPDPAYGVNVADPVPPGMAVVSAPGCTTAGTAINCPVASLASGASTTFLVTLSVTAAHAQTIVNTATVTSLSADPNVSNNSASASIGSTSLKAVQVSQTVSRKVLSKGQTTTFSIKATNPNSTTLHNVRVCQQLPSGLAYVSSSPHARLTGGRYCVTIGTLRPGASRTIKVKARALGLPRSMRLTDGVTATADHTRAAHSRASVQVRGTSAATSPVTG